MNFNRRYTFHDQSGHVQDTVGAAGFHAEAEPVRKSKKSGRGPGKAVALALVCALLGGAVGGLGVAGASGLLGGDQEGTTSIYQGERPLAVVNTVQMNTDQVLTPQEIYATYLDACVGINAGVTTNIWGWTTTSAASGSGFVISEDGYIVTNYHVVENASTITVNFADGRSYDAAYVGGEESNDVAVLKIEAEHLTPVVLGDSDNMLVGDNVYTIGNPLGELTYTMTDGMVSALDRTVTNENGITMNMLQTNCTINSGNSGGPLFNQYGEVIGITSAKLSGSSSSSATIEGLGFAIPMNDVREIITELVEQGYVRKPYLGISVFTVSETDAQRYNLPVGTGVKSVVEGGAAQRAGLQSGDIITAVDGEAVTDHYQFIAAVNRYKPEESAVFTVTRSGDTLEITVTFDEAPRSTQASEGAVSYPYQPNAQQGSGNGSYFPFGW